MNARPLAAALLLTATAAAMPAYAEDAIVITGQPVPAAAKVRESVSRPALLTSLYATYAGLQAYDVHSTRQALSRGARETNPLMQGVVGDSGGMIALKASVTVGTIVAAERL